MKNIKIAIYYICICVVPIMNFYTKALFSFTLLGIKVYPSNLPSILIFIYWLRINYYYYLNSHLDALSKENKIKTIKINVYLMFITIVILSVFILSVLRANHIISYTLKSPIIPIKGIFGVVSLILLYLIFKLISENIIGVYYQKKGVYLKKAYLIISFIFMPIGYFYLTYLFNKIDNGIISEEKKDGL